MRIDGNAGSKVSIQPNNYHQWEGDSRYKEPDFPIDGPINRYEFAADDHDYYTQPGKLFRLMSKEEQQRLFENTARAIAGVPEKL